MRNLTNDVRVNERAHFNVICRFFILHRSLHKFALIPDLNANTSNNKRKNLKKFSEKQKTQKNRFREMLQTVPYTHFYTHTPCDIMIID